MELGIPVSMSEDCREGTKAFKEKRKPVVPRAMTSSGTFLRICRLRTEGRRSAAALAVAMPLKYLAGEPGPVDGDGRGAWRAVHRDGALAHAVSHAGGGSGAPVALGLGACALGRRRPTAGGVVRPLQDFPLVSVRGVLQHQVRVDRRAIPPSRLGVELEDREVQVRRLAGVAGGADVADDVAAPDGLALAQSGDVPIEVRVVVGERRRRIEEVDRDAAGDAQEELRMVPSSTATTGVPFAAGRSSASCGRGPRGSSKVVVKSSRAAPRTGTASGRARRRSTSSADTDGGGTGPSRS